MQTEFQNVLLHSFKQRSIADLHAMRTINDKTCRHCLSPVLLHGAANSSRCNHRWSKSRQCPCHWFSTPACGPTIMNSCWLHLLIASVSDELSPKQNSHGKDSGEKPTGTTKSITYRPDTIQWEQATLTNYEVKATGINKNHEKE